MLNLNNTEFKTKSEIRQLASSIFTTQGAPNTSDKYAHISTEKIIDDMQLLGFQVK